MHLLSVFQGDVLPDFCLQHIFKVVYLFAGSEADSLPAVCRPLLGYSFFFFPPGAIAGCQVCYAA